MWRFSFIYSLQFLFKGYVSLFLIYVNTFLLLYFIFKEMQHVDYSPPAAVFKGMHQIIIHILCLHMFSWCWTKGHKSVPWTMLWIVMKNYSSYLYSMITKILIFKLKILQSRKYVPKLLINMLFCWANNFIKWYLMVIKMRIWVKRVGGWSSIFVSIHLCLMFCYLFTYCFDCLLMKILMDFENCFVIFLCCLKFYFNKYL